MPLRRLDQRSLLAVQPVNKKKFSVNIHDNILQIENIYIYIYKILSVDMTQVPDSWKHVTKG